MFFFRLSCELSCGQSVVRNIVHVTTFFLQNPFLAFSTTSIDMMRPLPDISKSDSRDSSLFVGGDTSQTSHPHEEVRLSSAAVILFIQSRGSKIGCAGYNKELKQLTCFLDITFAGFDSVEEFTSLYAKS